jgi:hypothetical protein
MAKASRFDLIEEARLLARAGGLFVVPAGVDFVVYRKVAPARNVRLGSRRSPRALLDFVRRCSGRV